MPTPDTDWLSLTQPPSPRNRGRKVVSSEPNGRMGWHPCRCRVGSLAVSRRERQRRLHSRPPAAWSLLAGVVIFGPHKVSLVVIPILLALILTAVIAPLVARLKRQGMKPATATGPSFLAMITDPKHPDFLGRVLDAA